ncbi:hypothetical protein CDAR_476521 [Caerostris darwini]|uniref:Uncharacterized protein n=1 Tax=Caerostris darwini TaxID=1538125 RepID=A0AAV4PFM5_9ARAC|nr:hypothetical protein CDAR_476521 [Caerostris darwini]
MFRFNMGHFSVPPSENEDNRDDPPSIPRESSPTPLSGVAMATGNPFIEALTCRCPCAVIGFTRTCPFQEDE